MMDDGELQISCITISMVLAKIDMDVGILEKIMRT